MTTLICENVTYQYEKGSKVLEHITTQFETGKMYAILGASGSGKTTLLSLIGGLDIPQEGKIMFNGRDISEMGLEYHRRNHVSVIFQNYNLIDYMTPIENVKLTAKQDALPILKQLGLTEDEAKRNVMKLSGGQQQRVAIARTLVSNAPVILADEPTGALDPQNSENLMELLLEINKKFKTTILMVTHDSFSASYCNRILFLENGKISYEIYRGARSREEYLGAILDAQKA